MSTLNSNSKKQTAAELKQEYRRWEKGAPERRRRYLKLVRYARGIREISARYLPQNKPSMKEAAND